MNDILRILKDAKKRKADIRLGQEVFNLSFNRFPNETNKLRGTDIDCFYRNSVEDCKVFLRELNRIRD